jgi:replication factor C subunit 3/5
MDEDEEINFIVDIDEDIIKMKNNRNTKIENLPWVEKYRPSVIDEIIGNKNIKQALNTYLKENKLPHLLLHGPSGTGKTSIINSYARQAYGDYYGMMVLQINASEERGIEIIRNKVKNFVITKCIYKVQPFKLVILDEADSMTFSAQSMLRRIIEDYTENARFCLICNKVKNIDLAIQSRCTQFKFSNLSHDDMKNGLLKICKLNKIKYTDDGIDFLIKISKGDMRKTINNLQSISMVYKLITYENVCIFFGYPSIKHIETIYETVTKNKFDKSYEIIKDIVYSNQYSFLEIINETHQYLLDKFQNNKIPIERFKTVINKLKNLEYNIYICPLDELITAAFVSCFF